MANAKDGNPLDFLLPTGINTGLNLLGNLVSGDSARKNLDYQMDRYYSPQAQVRNLAAAGINPAVAFGNQSPVFSGGGSFSLPQNPLAGVGTQSMTDVANYLLAKANAKKAGADTRKADAEADSIYFENELNRLFKQPERVANLMAAYKSMQLLDDEHSRNEWITAKEKALSELSGIQKDTAKKVFDNMDIQIKQENKQREEDIKLTQEKQKTEQTSQSANTASARASNTQADINLELKKINAIEREVLETGKVDKINAYLSELRSKKLLNNEQYEELRQKMRSLKHRNDYADVHQWYGAFLNIMDDVSYYLDKLNPLHAIKLGK